jgi:hypothetical protein
LFGLDDTHDAHVEKAADMGGFVHQHKNVEWVAVFAEGGRKHHTFGKQAAQFEQVRFGIVVEFISAPFRGFDYGSAME